MRDANIKKHDVIEGLKSLKLHKLLRIAYRCRYDKQSLTGIPELFVSTKLNSYWLRIKVDKEKISPVQKHFLSSESNPMVLHIDQKKCRLTLYCKNTDLVLNHVLGQLALTFAKRSGHPWKLRQKPLERTPQWKNQKIKEVCYGSI